MAKPSTGADDKYYPHSHNENSWELAMKIHEICNSSTRLPRRSEAVRREEPADIIRNHWFSMIFSSHQNMAKIGKRFGYGKLHEFTRNKWRFLQEQNSENGNSSSKTSAQRILDIYLYIYLHICVCVCLFIYLFIHSCIDLSIYLFTLQKLNHRSTGISNIVQMLARRMSLNPRTLVNTLRS